MVLKKFLNGLPLFVTMVMLLACPKGMSQKGGSNGDARLTETQKKGVETMSNEDIEARMSGIKEIDPTDLEMMFTKVVKIMKSSQGSGQYDVDFFYPGSFFLRDIQYGKMTPIIKQGSRGGTFTMSANPGGAGSAGAVGASPSVFKEKGHVDYEYNNYSIDGIYELTGKLVLVPYKDGGYSNGSIGGGARCRGSLSVASPYYCTFEGTGAELSIGDDNNTLILKMKDSEAAKNIGFPEHGIKIEFEKGIGVDVNKSGDLANRGKTAPTSVTGKKITVKGAAGEEKEFKSDHALYQELIKTKYSV